MNAFLGPIRKILHPLGVAITRPSTIESLVKAQRELGRINAFHGFLAALTPDAAAAALKLFPGSRGESFQDIFALLVLEERADGFFVEFGATNGIEGSNSYLMESRLGWSGILAEPARCWHNDLQRNRSVAISHKCVWRESGVRLSFRETRDAGFSTLDNFSANDHHRARRTMSKIYEVETITLSQLLHDHTAPNVIDYMSIDTEGSEVDILEVFDFTRHRPLVLTVEHNYRPEREKMIAIMFGQGYLRAPPAVSACDDWFVCGTLADRLPAIFKNSTLRNL